jgi:hypothetical protein
MFGRLGRLPPPAIPLDGRLICGRALGRDIDGVRPPPL